MSDIVGSEFQVLSPLHNNIKAHVPGILFLFGPWILNLGEHLCWLCHTIDCTFRQYGSSPTYGRSSKNHQSTRWHRYLERPAAFPAQDTTVRMCIYSLSRCEGRSYLTIILSVDLFTSIISMTPPRLAKLNNKDPPEPPRKILGLDVHCILDSPLYRHLPQHRLDNVTVGPPFDQTSIRLLQIMRTLSLQPSPMVKTALLSEAAAIYQAQEPSPHTTPLFKTILHTSLIYSRAFHIDPIPFSSPINSNSLAILVQELESEVNDETWLRYPGVFLWVILTATVAAEGRPERAFLTQLFYKIVPVAKWGWWTEIRASMLTFLDVRRMAEGRISEIS